MYLRLGLLLCLALFLVSNALFSLLVACLAWSLSPLLGRMRPKTRASLLFSLRLAPALLSAAFVLGLFAPSYILFEPAGTREAPGIGLMVLSLAALLLLGHAFRRGLASRLATTRLLRSWLDRAERRPELGRDVYGITEAFPVVSVIGKSRPRIFVARQVLEALSPEELRVVLAHEEAHVHSGDNLKREVVRWIPDFVGLLGPGRWLEREWHRATEVAADSRAVGGSVRRALDLSAALITVARLAGREASARGALALYDGDSIEFRIRYLLGGPETSDGTSDRLLAVAALAAGSLLLVNAAQLLGAIHEVTELFVQLLHEGRGSAWPAEAGRRLCPRLQLRPR